MKKNTQTIKQGLLLLGSFNIAYNLAILFHELSHGMTAIITGGTFSSIVINPFSWSYSYSFSPNQFAHISAGALGAVLISGVLFFILYRWANPWLLPILLIAPIAMMQEGIYYIVDIIMRSGGDACRLAGMGVHSAVLITLSLFCVVIGLVLAVPLIRKMGLFLFDFKGRLIVLGLGILPSTLAMLIWNWVYNSNELLLWAVYTVATIVLTLIVAVIPKRIWESKNNTPKLLKWKTAGIINILYVGLLIFWLVGPFSANNALGIKTFSERPEDFPLVMTAPDFATDESYFRSSVYVEPFFLNYSCSESISPDQITDFISSLHKQHDYILLTHWIDDPNEIFSDDWEEETDQIDGVTVKTKHYRQNWLKVGTPPLESLISVSYFWKKDGFKDAFVIHNVFEYPEYEQLYNYAKVHPEQFDPNQIQQLRTLSLTQKESLEGSIENADNMEEN